MRLAFLILALLAVGCTRRPAPVVSVHYVVGTGYQAGGTWFYPREDFHYDATGLASVLPGRGGTTADGEAADATALTAAHQTLQLPCIVRVTNLETGTALLVRVNDRGPATPSRLIALSPRAATLLGITGVARVRVQVEETPSLALREQLNGGPRLTVAAAPRASVRAESLAPPPGVAQSGRVRSAGAARAVETAEQPAAERVPERLPETVLRGAASPGQLVIRAGSFGRMDYARQVAARLSALGTQVQRVRKGGRSSTACSLARSPPSPRPTRRWTAPCARGYPMRGSWWNSGVVQC